ncbi:MAG: SPOR domain-containing protein [Candidimonas sp.]|nr:MAG: SPOR domain-containing protein [Candidimonas sp.]
MARKRMKSGKSGGLSGAMMGLITGLVLGVGAAVAVALYVTEVPMPFADKASRGPESTPLPAVQDAPDPNSSLYGADGAAGTAPSAPSAVAAAPSGSSAAPATPPAPEATASAPHEITRSATPPPGTGPSANGEATARAKARHSADALGSLIASLDKTAEPRRHAAAPEPSTSTRPRSAATRAAPAQGTQTLYYLQAGAFHSSKDAESVKARILMLGLVAQVQTTTINGATINRVRVGPFHGIDAMNRARAKLGDDQIASSVVRP